MDEKERANFVFAPPGTATQGGGDNTTETTTTTPAKKKLTCDETLAGIVDVLAGQEVAYETLIASLIAVIAKGDETVAAQQQQKLAAAQERIERREKEATDTKTALQEEIQTSASMADALEKANKDLQLRGKQLSELRKELEKMRDYESSQEGELKLANGVITDLKNSLNWVKQQAEVAKRGHEEVESTFKESEKVLRKEYEQTLGALNLARVEISQLKTYIQKLENQAPVGSDAALLRERDKQFDAVILELEKEKQMREKATNALSAAENRAQKLAERTEGYESEVTKLKQQYDDLAVGYEHEKQAATSDARVKDLEEKLKEAQRRAKQGDTDQRSESGEQLRSAGEQLRQREAHIKQVEARVETLETELKASRKALREAVEKAVSHTLPTPEEAEETIEAAGSSMWGWLFSKTEGTRGDDDSGETTEPVTDEGVFAPLASLTEAGWNATLKKLTDREFTLGKMLDDENFDIGRYRFVSTKDISRVNDLLASPGKNNTTIIDDSESDDDEIFTPMFAPLGAPLTPSDSVNLARYERVVRHYAAANGTQRLRLRFTSASSATELELVVNNLSARALAEGAAPELVADVSGASHHIDYAYARGHDRDLIPARGSLSVTRYDADRLIGAAWTTQYVIPPPPADAHPFGTETVLKWANGTRLYLSYVTPTLYAIKLIVMPDTV